MAQIIADIVIHKTFVDGDDVLTWFDLHTKIARRPARRQLEPHRKWQGQNHSGDI